MRSERVVLAQRTPPPAPPADQGGAVIPAAVAAGTVAAAIAAFASLNVPDPSAAVGLAIRASAVAQASSAILASFDEAHADRRATLEGRVLGKLAVELPAADPDGLRALARAEVERERIFQAKARVRLQADLPRALAIDDPEQRRIALRKILERERRYAELREDAIAARLGGQVEFERQRAILEPQGVTGMYWRLNPRLEHCARCLALAGKIWPWQLLAIFHPPMHLNCGCRLWEPENAFRFGWATRASVATVDDAISMMHLLESAPDPVHDPEGFWLRETFDPTQPRDWHGRWVRIFADRVAADTWAREHFKTWLDGLHWTESRELLKYKDGPEGHYQVVNETLRGTRAAAPLTVRAARRIDGALRRGSVPAVRVFRAVPSSWAGDQPLEPGRVRRDDAFSSVTLIRDIAMADYAPAREDPMLLEALLPAGTPAGYLDPIRRPSDSRELLLPAGAQWRVHSIREQDGIRIAEVELEGFKQPALLRGDPT